MGNQCNSKDAAYGHFENKSYGYMNSDVLLDFYSDPGTLLNQLTNGLLVVFCVEEHLIF